MKRRKSDSSPPHPLPQHPGLSPVHIHVQSTSPTPSGEQPLCSYGKGSDSTVQLIDMDSDEEIQPIQPKIFIHNKPTPRETVIDIDVSPGGSNNGGSLRRRVAHVSIEMRNRDAALDDLGEDVQHSGRLEYLDIYLRQMFCCGMSLYRPPKFLKGKEGSMCFKTLMVVQKVAFWTFIIISLMDSISYTKLYFFFFLHDGGKEASVNLSYYIFTLFFKAYSAYLLAKLQQKITKMLDLLYKSPVVPSRKTSFKIFALGVLTILLAFAKMLAVAGFPYSWQKSILTQSYGLSTRVLPWNVEHLIVTMQQLQKDYGTNPTALNMFLGGTSVVMELFSHLQMDMTRDLIMVVAVTMHQHVAKFILRIKDDTNFDAERDHSPEKQTEREENWARYRELRELNDATNDVFSTLLKLMHINNVLLFAYFVNAVVNQRDKKSVFIFIMLMFNLWKASHTYYIASKAADHNDTCEQWLRNWARGTGVIVVKGEVWQLSIALKELKKKPLGLGRGSFLINGVFTFKFGGIVGSVFGFLGDEDDEDSE